MTLGIPEWWPGLGKGNGGRRRAGTRWMQGCGEWKSGRANRGRGVRLIETREIQYLLNEKDEFQ